MSGLSDAHKIQARDVACAAAVASIKNSWKIHYSQGGRRWEGITKDLKFFKGEFPAYTDCSAILAWWIKQGLDHVGAEVDTLNRLNWKGGSTYSMLATGPFVSTKPSAWLRGDALIYRGHTALYLGGGKVASHGSESGPLLLPWDYRNDLVAVRRAIL